MPWGRIDDAHWRHRKVAQLRHGPLFAEAVALYWLAISWCNDYGTDGRVTPVDVAMLGCDPDAISELVRVGLWDVDGNGYVVHDFLKFNKSAAQVAEDKARYADLAARGVAARTTATVSDTVDLPANPVSRTPVLQVNPVSSAGEDAIDAYANLVGKPTRKVMDWLDRLQGTYGTGSTVQALVMAYGLDSNPATLIGRTEAALKEAKAVMDAEGREAELDRASKRRFERMHQRRLEHFRNTGQWPADWGEGPAAA